MEYSGVASVQYRYIDKLPVAFDVIGDPWNARNRNTLIVLFNGTWNPDAAPNTDGKLTTYDFQEVTGWGRVPIDIGEEKSAVCLYKVDAVKNVILVVPHDFHTLFTSMPSKNVWKVLMHKISKGIRTTLHDPEKLRQRMKDSVISALTHHYTAGVRIKESLVHDLEIQRNTHAEQLAASIQRLTVERMQLQGMRDGGGIVQEQQELIDQEVEDVLAWNKVKTVTYDNSRQVLTICTEFLFFHNPQTNVLHQLGEIRIEFRMQDYSWVAKNLTHHWKGSFDHPHINAGNVCYGSFGVGLPEMLMQGRFAVFLDMLLQFLETCNPKDDWGKYSYYWPVHDESDATEEWKSIKESLQRELIMKPVKAPEKKKTDDAVLDDHKEKVKSPEKAKTMRTRRTQVRPAVTTGHDYNEVVQEGIRERAAEIQAAVEGRHIDRGLTRLWADTAPRMGGPTFNRTYANPTLLGEAQATAVPNMEDTWLGTNFDGAEVEPDPGAE